MISAYTATSMQHNSVNVCPGQLETFLCEVPKQGIVPRLEWKIDFDFEDTHPVTRRYTSNDPEGLILRDDRLGVSFVFNLTSNSPSSLVSAMTVIANDTNATTLINYATVNCVGDEAYPKVLHINEGT